MRILLLIPFLLAACTLTPWECDDYQTCELAAGDAPAAAAPAGAVSPLTPVPAAQSTEGEFLKKERIITK